MTPARTLAGAAGFPETMGLEEAANYLRLGREATRKLFERGELPGVSLNQKHIVFRRAALDAFLAKVEQEQATARQAGKDPNAANDADGQNTRTGGAGNPGTRRRRTPRIDFSKYSNKSDEGHES